MLKHSASRLLGYYRHHYHYYDVKRGKEEKKVFLGIHEGVKILFLLVNFSYAFSRSFTKALKVFIL